MRSERAPHRALLLALVLLLSACASSPERGSPAPGATGSEPSRPTVDTGPLEVPEALATQPDPEPVWEPVGRAGNRSPYVVFGKTYHVMPSARGYQAEGLASWYGRKFHGRATSNGERYDMFKLSAAHRSLPLPTWLRVTNLDNERTIIVRVNDRGPFHSERILDLSYGAAVKLGFVHEGLARVRIEAITPPSPEELAAAELAAEQGVVAEPGSGVLAAPAPVAARELLWLQVGAFRSYDSARAVGDRLLEVLGDEAHKLHFDESLPELTRVRIGPLQSQQEADRLQALVAAAELGGVPLIIRE